MTGAGPEDPRIRLSGERTLLAWIRTGLGLMGFGFVVARFGLFLREMAEMNHREPPRTTGVSMWIGTAVVALGVISVLIAAVQHGLFLRRLDRADPYKPSAWSPAIAVAAILGLLGVIMVVHLIRLRS